MVEKESAVCLEFEGLPQIVVTEDDRMILYESDLTVVPYKPIIRASFLKSVLSRSSIELVNGDEFIYLDREKNVLRYCLTKHKNNIDIEKNYLYFESFVDRLTTWIGWVNETAANAGTKSKEYQAPFLSHQVLIKA